MHPEDKEIEDVKKQYLLQLVKAIEEDDVDRILVPVLKKLNELPGVVTQYSCTGHKTHGSPTAYLHIVVSKKKEKVLHKYILDFLQNAPFPLRIDFEYSIDNPLCSQMCTRMKIYGDVHHNEDACLPMFHYIYDFLAPIGSSTNLFVEYPENHLQ